MIYWIILLSCIIRVVVVCFTLFASGTGLFGSPGEELPLLTVWGEATNDVRGGLTIFRFEDGRLGRIEAHIAPVTNSGPFTNTQLFNLPDQKCLFAVKMKPIVGKQPKPTAYGIESEKATLPKAQLTERGRTWVVMRNEFPRFIGSFRATDYFTFESDGVYELEVALTLYKANGTAKSFSIFKLPPIRKQIKIEADTREGLKSPRVELLSK
jgi:hypothetical protein